MRNKPEFWIRLIALAAAGTLLLAGPSGCGGEKSKPEEQAQAESAPSARVPGERAGAESESTVAVLQQAGDPESMEGEKTLPEGPPGTGSNLRNRQVGRNLKIPGLFQNWSPHVVPSKLSVEQKEKIAKLESLGYVSGSTAAPTNKNVIFYDKERAYRGLNLYTSGHAAEATLIDMDGRTLHKWRYNFRDFMPDYEPVDNSYSHLFWRRAHLFPNGDLLAIYEGICMVKLDKDSNLIWGYAGRPHHDIFVHPDGRIFTLTRRGVVNPKYDAADPILEDFVTVLDAEGKEIRRVSILGALERSDYAPLLQKRHTRAGDILHTNTIQVLDGKLEHLSPAFRKGNVLVSILYLDFIGVIDMDQEKFVWGMRGPFKRQHQPILTDQGRMWVFDNEGGEKRLGGSRILEFDPLTARVVWSYEGTEEDEFYSYNCGTMQLLPNGDVLISESTTGRVLEVTPDKEKVWEWLNPHRAGAREQYIANVFEMERFGPDFPFEYLDQRPE